jgi:hypothetical protein
MQTLPKPNRGASQATPVNPVLPTSVLDGKVVFESGATRNAGVIGDDGDIPLRYDLMLDNTQALKRIARTYGEGSLKYPPRNWMLGFPESSLLNHVTSHLIAHREGDQSEDHLAHACWNLMTLMWVQDEMPHLLDATGLLVNENSSAENATPTNSHEG